MTENQKLLRHVVTAYFGKLGVEFKGDTNDLVDSSGEIVGEYLGADYVDGNITVRTRLVKPITYIPISIEITADGVKVK